MRKLRAWFLRLFSRQPSPRIRRRPELHDPNFRAAFRYMVTLRQTELGVRMPLGAAPGSILRLVLGDVFFILGAGLAVGTGLALASVQVLQSLLFALAARDVLTLALAAGVLALVGFVAGYLPARRAAKANPLVALGYE